MFEILICFTSINNNFIPTEPFHLNTEKWTDTTNMLAENMSIICKLVLTLIVRCENIFNNLVAIIDEKN